jgi:hypothetical protein
MENNLILRVLTSPYNDNTRGSVLDHEDVDGNFIYLKGNLIKSGTTQNNNLLLQSLNGEIVTIPLNFTGTTTGGTGIAGISALTFDTHNTIILKDTTQPVVHLVMLKVTSQQHLDYIHTLKV